MKDTIENVFEFHRAFNHPVSDVPEIGNRELNDLRVRLLQEELFELEAALDDGDIEETFDALLDLQYVLDGAFLALGFWKAKLEGIDEVHASNMSKLGEDGKAYYRPDGKVLKGPNFRNPDLSPIIERLFELENKYRKSLA